MPPPSSLAKSHQQSARCVWVTRPKQDAAEHAAALSQCGFTPLISPVLKIVPSKNALCLETLPASAPDAVIVSSTNALRFLPQNFTRFLAKLPIFVSGQATADFARQTGFTSVHLPKGRGSRGIAARIKTSMPPDTTNSTLRRLLYLTGAPHKTLLQEDLKHKYEIMIVETYAAKPSQLTKPAIEALKNQEVEAVTLFSERSAKYAAYSIKQAFSKTAAQKNLASLFAVCISPHVAQAAISYGFKQTAFAEHENQQSIVNKLVEQLT